MTKRTYTHYLYRTSFHGGGLISRHTTRELAEAAQRRYRMTDCVCGCSVVVRLCDAPSLPDAHDCHTPYCAAL